MLRLPPPRRGLPPPSCAKTRSAWLCTELHDTVESCLRRTLEADELLMSIELEGDRCACEVALRTDNWLLVEVASNFDVVSFKTSDTGGSS